MPKVTLPNFPVAGGCQCGSVRYALKGPPVTFYICHCTECQKQSASAFGQSLRVRNEDLAVAGNLTRFARKSPNGSVLSCEFCRDCGTRLFHRRETYRNELNIKAGTLDDSSWLFPAGHIWTGSKQAWISVAPDDLAYLGQPPDFSALEAKWHAMTG